MDKYRVDWKDIVNGYIELEASNAKEALVKLRNMPKDELFKNSNWNTDGIDLKVTFIEKKFY